MTDMPPPRRLKTLQSPGRASKGPLAQEIAALGPWFHNLHLPDGLQTAPDHPLGDFPRRKWNELAAALPEDLHGANVLDVGCNAGFYSFELANRGARVLAIDSDEHYLQQARWARDRHPSGDRVEFMMMQVYEVPRLAQQFDLVLFMGVFYHLRYPVLALDLVADRARDRLVFQSLTMRDDEPPPHSRSLEFDEMEELNEPGWPKLAFIAGELAGDPTNWWVPNQACMQTLIQSVGFRVESRPGHELFVCRRARSWRKQRASFSEQLHGVLGVPRHHCDGGDDSPHPATRKSRR
jgi:tRNA (mo5U34)-methyltransferase